MNKEELEDFVAMCLNEMGIEEGECYEFARSLIKGLTEKGIVLPTE